MDYPIKNILISIIAGIPDSTINELINHINADPELVSLFAELSNLRDTAFNKRLWLRCLEVALRNPRKKYSFWEDIEPDTIEAAIEIIKKQISNPPKTKKR